MIDTVKAPRKPTPRASAAVRLGEVIRKAEAEGVARTDMTLHLTHSDVSALNRDREIPVTDIGYEGGAMYYLGVKVEQGGVAESVLRIAGA